MEIYPEADTGLDLKEVEITTQRSGGKGGQNVNKVESSVRVRHIPTGITVRIDGRDQPDNKELALLVLERRLHDKEVAEKHERENNARRNQLDGGSRSGKVRTYSYIQGRVQDHRTGKSASVKAIMGGDFDQLK